MNKLHSDTPYIPSTGNLILHQCVCFYSSILIVLNILIESQSKPLGCSSLYLNSRKVRVYNLSTVYHRQEVHYLYLSSISIHLYLGKASYKRRRRSLSPPCCCGYKLISPLKGHRFQRHFLKAQSVPLFILHKLSVKVKGLSVHTHKLSCCSIELISHLLSSKYYCITSYICTTGSIGSRIIWRTICIGGVDNNILHLTLKHLCRHLCQHSIRSLSHICNSGKQHIVSVIPKLYSGRSCIYTSDPGSLHSYCHTSCSYLAVLHYPGSFSLLPVKHLLTLSHTILYASAHYIGITARFHKIFISDLCRIHIYLSGKFIYSRLQGKCSLGGTISSKGTCRHCVGIHYLSLKPHWYLLIQREGFKGYQRCHCRSVFSVGPLVGQALHIDGFYISIPVCSKLHSELHSMTACCTGMSFSSVIYYLSRFPGYLRHYCRKYLRCCSLLSAKSSPDSWLYHPYLTLGHLQSSCQMSLYMEGNLS